MELFLFVFLKNHSRLEAGTSNGRKGFIRALSLPGAFCFYGGIIIMTELKAVEKQQGQSIEDVIDNFDIYGVVKKLSFLGRIMSLDEIGLECERGWLSQEEIQGIGNILENTAREISEFSSDLYGIINGD